MLILEHMMPLVLICMAIAIAIIVLLLSSWRYLQINIFNIIIVIVRLMFLALLTWCMLQPSYKKSIINLLKPRFLVLVDSTKSMLKSPPVPEATNRWTEAKRVLDAEQYPWVNVIGAECDIDGYSFATDLSARMDLSAVKSIEVNGASTVLRSSLRKMCDRYRGQNVTGILLLTDGIDTREANDDWTTEKWPVPIYSVRLEPPAAWEVEPNIRVDSVTTPRRVTVGWETELKALISGEGTKGQAINVQLFRNGALLNEAPTQIPDGGGAREVSFKLQNPQIGVYTYRIYLPPLPREVYTNDNEYIVNVMVIDSKNRLLYVEGPPTAGYRFLKRVLQDNKQSTPLCFFRGPKGKYQVSVGVQGSMTTDMTEAQLAFFKIVILGDFDKEELGEQRALNLAKFVEDGGSLVLLGGTKAWGPSGWDNTPLKKILPMKSHGSMVDGKFPISITPEGRAHSAFQGDAKFWEEMPPVLSAFADVTLSAGAESLVTAETGNGSVPLIVAQRYGQGKVVAICTDTLWKWQLDPKISENRPFQRFWDQLLVWLSPTEKEGTTRKLDIFADKEQMFLGEQIEISSRLADQNDKSAEGITVNCEVTTPDKRTIPFTMAKQQVIASGKSYAGFAFKFNAEVPGLHQAVAVTEVEGKKIVSDPISFFVKTYTPEEVPRPAKIEILTALAAGSGGKFCENANELNEVLSSLNFSKKEEETTKYFSLWQHWAAIGGLIVLLSLEWIIRKLRNMP